jgi:hypothetical protein
VLLFDMADASWIDIPHTRVRVGMQCLQDLAGGLFFDIDASAVAIAVGQLAHQIVVANQGLDWPVDGKGSIR